MSPFDKKNLNIPNALTAVRIILIVPFLVFFFRGNTWGALITIGFSGLSDALDGYIARHYNQITPLGKLLDPLADKLTQTTIALCISLRVPILLPVFGVFVVKENLMLIGACVLLKQKKRPSAARWYGKAATISFYVSIVLVFLSHVFFSDKPALIVVSLVFLAITVLLMVYSFIQYAKIYRDLMREAKEEASEVEKEALPEA